MSPRSVRNRLKKVDGILPPLTDRMNVQPEFLAPGAPGVTPRAFLGIAPGAAPVASGCSHPSAHALKLAGVKIPLMNFQLEQRVGGRPLRIPCHEMSFECPVALRLGQGYPYFVDDVFVGDLYILRTGSPYRGVIKCDD